MFCKHTQEETCPLIDIGKERLRCCLRMIERGVVAEPRNNEQPEEVWVVAVCLPCVCVSDGESKSCETDARRLTSRRHMFCCNRCSIIGAHCVDRLVAHV